MKNPERTAHRWGSELGSVCYDGQMILMDHPVSEQSELSCKAF
ncbi:MAG: hypothetical protein RDU01_06260 [Thermodesulfovibrionales bacterium]|nr:hypothetical protein [Thermodesulfovibrionales bacterium]